MSPPDTQQEVSALADIYNEGRYPEAERAALDFIARHPNSETAWKVLWASLERQGKSSFAALQKLITLSPKDAEAHFNLGATLTKREDIDGAINAYQRSIELKPDYAEAFNNLGQIYYSAGRFGDASDCCQRAIQYKPNFVEAHTNLAHIFAKQRQPLLAISHYRKALDIAPTFLEAQHGLNTVLTKSVPKWHVPMMNEHQRNDAYFSALKAAITADTKVLEIGTGSGLLAMMAAKAGAQKVTTCEVEPLLAETARQIIADNNFDKIVSVIPKASTKVEVGADLETKADVLVSEIFSNELLGEGVLRSLEDAKKRLLIPGGRVIPATGSIMIALFGGDDAKRNLLVENSYGFNLQRFNDIVPKKATIIRHDLDIQILTDDVEAFRFEFEKDAVFPGETKTLNIPVKTAGVCHGIIQWIRLDMDDVTVYENHPRQKSAVANWQHFAFVFPSPMHVTPGQVAVIAAHHDKNTPWFTFLGMRP